MTKLLTCLTLLIFLSFHGRTQDLPDIDTTLAARQSPQAAKAKLVATNFAQGLMKGASADDLLKLTLTPFAKDEGAPITDKEELRKFLAGISAESYNSAQKNHPHIDSVFVYGVRKGETGPDIYLIVVSIKFSIKGQEPINQALFGVMRKGDLTKVVGIYN